MFCFLCWGGAETPALDKKELRKLSKNQLIDIILNLEHRLTMFENAHTPSSKQRKKNTSSGSKPRFPGKPAGSGGGGLELPPPDEVENHTLSACPDCDSGLKHLGVSKHTVIDFPEKPIIVTEHRVHEYYCACCHKVVLATTVPHNVYGPHLRSVVVMLKNLCLSCEKIAGFLRELGAPSFSCAQVQRIIDECSDKLEKKRASLLALLRQAPFVHADETGFRKDGKNGYVWGVFTPTITVLSATLSRAREQIQQLLPAYKGVVVSDGYNAYNLFEKRQRCWAHLLREFKELAKENNEINTQYTRLKTLYEKIKTLTIKPPDKKHIKKARAELNDIGTCLKVIKGAHKLTTLLENGGNDWLTALQHPGTPLTNNHAERGLRHIVLHRKNNGCYRNHKGQAFINNTISTLQTWKLQQKNTYQQLLTLQT